MAGFCSAVDILGPYEPPRVSDHIKASGFFARLRLFDLKVHIEDLAGFVGDRFGLRFGSRSSSSRCLSGFNVPNHRLTICRNVDMLNGHFLLALAAVFIQDLDLAGIDERGASPRVSALDRGPPKFAP